VCTHIDVQREVPGVLTDLETHSAGDAGIGEIHIDRAEGFLGARNQLCDLRFVGDVRPRGDRRTGVGRVDLVRNDIYGALIEVRDEHPRTLLGKALRQRAADATPATGDDGDLLCTLHSDSFPS